MDNQWLDADLDKPTTPQYKNGYAGFWERFGAAFLDGLLLAVVSFLVLGAFGIGLTDLYQGAAKGEDPTELFGAKYYWASIVNLLINWYYFAQQESSVHQATLGKRALGLIVTDINDQRLSFQQASVRFWLKQLMTIGSLLGSALAMPELVTSVSFLALVNYLVQPFTARKQALHDMIAKTLVYKK
ncbi:MAG: RDD family protein [Saprospiraceae bacterium]|nr:RDD family protein [Saprospiraceae bacterium]